MRVFQPRASDGGRAHRKNPGARGIRRRRAAAPRRADCAKKPLKTAASAFRAAAQRNFARGRIGMDARGVGIGVGIQSRAGSSPRGTARGRAGSRRCADAGAGARGGSSAGGALCRRGTIPRGLGARARMRSWRRRCTPPSPRMRTTRAARSGRRRPSARSPPRGARLSRGARAPGIRPTASRSGARPCARTRRSGARRGTARSARRRRCTPG